MTENNGRDSGGTNWKEFPIWFAALKPKEKIETIVGLNALCGPSVTIYFNDRW